MKNSNETDVELRDAIKFAEAQLEKCRAGYKNLLAYGTHEPAKEEALQDIRHLETLIRAATATKQSEELTVEDYKECIEDHKRLVRELDVALHGEDGAAKQASLCDIVAIVKERAKPSDIAEKQGGWMPIESAPRDENKYLFYTASGQIRTGRRVETLLDDCETIGFKNEAWLSCCEGEKVTHWQPLPPAPKSGG